MKKLVVPILIITLGIGWLLTTRNVIPGVNWIWVLGLGVSGLLLILAGGVNRSTMVIGPLLIISTVFSLLRQTGRIDLDIEVPGLVITLGVLMLLVRILPIPDDGRK